MKLLILILTMILSNKALAGNLCFNDQAVKDLIKASEALDNCFAKDDDECGLREGTPGEQQVSNARRLIPYDRTSGRGFLDRATGVVSAEHSNGKVIHGSSQKISRCHIITSAHVLFWDTKLSSDMKDATIKFKSGQTCDVNQPFKNEVEAKVAFRMLDEKTDFDCVGNNGKCENRSFKGHSDLVILKLLKNDKSDRSFYNLNTSNPNSHKVGQKVNCFGYPGNYIDNLSRPYNASLKLPVAKSNMMLWLQKDAQIFGDNNGTYEKGILTNAIAYKGMSGGGCVISNNPRELVGLFSNDNNSDGKSAIEINKGNAIKNGANFLSGFHNLEQRYHAKTGKRLADLD